MIFHIVLLAIYVDFYNELDIYCSIDDVVSEMFRGKNIENIDLSEDDDFDQDSKLNSWCNFRKFEYPK